MIHVKDHKTARFFDPWDYMGPKRRKLLDQSWAGLFREHILNALPVDGLAQKFKEEFGRPTKELYTMCGSVLLQQAFDLTDQQTVNELAFNNQWHYALDITEESDDSKYICEKTLWSGRNFMARHELQQKIFDTITERLAQVFGVNLEKQRLDSVHFHSNMKRLSRFCIMVRVLNKFLRNLQRHHEQLYAALPADLVNKYNTKKGLGCFSMVKPSEAEKTLHAVAQDLYALSELCCDNEQVRSMSSFKLLLRVLHEQCSVSPATDAAPLQVSPKPNCEISAESLQNPSDPEAGYDGHKGQGYQAQVMETYNDLADPLQKEQQLNLITYVEVESASAHDSAALLPALAETAECGLSPAEVLADSLYGSDRNVEAAREQGVEVVSPVMGSEPDRETLSLAEFEFAADDQVVRCPAGHAPLKTKKNKKNYSAVFEVVLCQNCEFSVRCPTRPAGPTRRYLRYSAKNLRLSRRRSYQQSAEFTDRYRMRSGVEATMSLFKRLTGVKHLRVRGMKAVNLAVTLKAAAVNLQRATRVRKARIMAGAWTYTGILVRFLAKLSFKERANLFFSRFRPILSKLLFPLEIQPEKC